MTGSALRDGATELIVGIDIGGTGTRFVAVGRSTLAVSSRVTVPTPSGGTQEEIERFLRKQLELVCGGRRPVGVGIGASGPIDLDGVIRNPDTLPAFTGLPVLQIVGALVDGPVEIDNDAVCAAIAEHAVGAAQGAARSLHITLGTGVGVCFLEGEVPFRLADGTHPEGGHISVATAGEACYCGRRSCWEQVASRRALQQAASEVLGRAPDQAMLGELAALAAGGGAVAQSVFADYGRAIADGLGTLLTLYGPTTVVIGGSAAEHFGLFREGIAGVLAELDSWIPEHRIVRTRLDDYGGAIGGAHLAAASLRVNPDMRVVEALEVSPAGRSLQQRFD